MYVSHQCLSDPWQLFKTSLQRNSYCVLLVLAVQSSVRVNEVSHSIIHLLRQVIKRCQSLPKLGLITPAVQAVFPASCSSPLADQDIQCKKRDTEWSDCISQPSTHALSNPLLAVFFCCLFVFLPPPVKESLLSLHMEF